MDGIVLEFFGVIKKRSILCFTADEVSDEDLCMHARLELGVEG